MSENVCGPVGNSLTNDAQTTSNDMISTPSNSSSPATMRCSIHPSSTSSDDGCDGSTVFYGVYIPISNATVDANDEQVIGIDFANDTAGELQQVYTDKLDVLKIVKQYQGARFKAFNNRSDALQFSKFSGADTTTTAFTSAPSSLPPSNVSSPCFGDLINRSTNSNAENTSLERGTAFRGPKAQELVKLRKAIECGNVDFFLQTVWANPRYLISSGDTPTILQEGPRYNALHIVAKARHTTMCRFVMNTIEDVKFMQLLYNDDSPNTRLRRINFLVDLYINMPDKALCETPLHFASKFGCLEIVEMLASHPVCVKHIQNKYNQTPKDIICTRYSSSCIELRRKIEEALEDNYIVPILGSVDNCSQPFIGKPWSPCKRLPLSADDKINQQSGVPDRSEQDDPLVTAPFVRAYAGPMSPKKAEEFHHRWKTPPRHHKDSAPASPWTGRTRLMGIRLTDSDKGLERVGRELARDFNIPWVEHWSFLSAYCDLSKPDGLNKLETYLRNKYHELTSANQIKCDGFSIDDISVFDESFDSSVFEEKESQTSSNGSLGSLCHKLSKMTINTINPDTSPILSQPLGQPPRVTRNTFLPVEQANEDAIRDEWSAKSAGGRRIGILMEHLCRDLAAKMTQEIYEYIKLDDNRQCPTRSPKNLNAELVSQVTPSVECLLRLARQGSIKSETNPHVRVASHIVRQLRDEFSQQEISASFRRLTSNDGNFCSGLSSDDESSEDDRNREYRGISIIRPLSKYFVRQHLRCISNLVTLLINDDNDGDVVTKCVCDWRGNQSSKSSSIVPVTNETLERTDSDDVFSDDSTDASFHTPPSSIMSSKSSSLSDAKTPEEGILVFINATEPSKLDVDVMRALEGCTIDPILYPHIYRWKHLVTSYSREETENWPTPMSLRTRSIGHAFGLQSRRTFSTPSRSSAPDHVNISPSINLQQRLQVTSTAVPSMRYNMLGSPNADMASIQANLYEIHNFVNE